MIYQKAFRIENYKTAHKTRWEECEMKNDPPLPLSSETPYERFIELGTKLMSVPKTEILELEKKWKKRKARRLAKPAR
jgi:hypothetical protein